MHLLIEYVSDCVVMYKTKKMWTRFYIEHIDIKWSFEDKGEDRKGIFTRDQNFMQQVLAVATSVKRYPNFIHDSLCFNTNEGMKVVDTYLEKVRQVGFPLHPQQDAYS